VLIHQYGVCFHIPSPLLLNVVITYTRHAQDRQDRAAPETRDFVEIPLRRVSKHATLVQNIGDMNATTSCLSPSGGRLQAARRLAGPSGFVAMINADEAQQGR
jgi:hypothetical protein